MRETNSEKDFVGRSEGRDPVWRLSGEALGDHTADRKTGDRQTVDAERVESGEHVARHALEPKYF